MHQLELQFPNPDGFEDLDRYVGKWIGEVKILTAPWFFWPEGQWRCLADVGGMLCVVALKVKREAYAGN